MTRKSGKFREMWLYTHKLLKYWEIATLKLELKIHFHNLELKYHWKSSPEETFNEQDHHVLTAVVCNHRQDVIVGPFVVEGFRVANDSVHVHDERLVWSQDLVFADVPELRGAVPVGGLDPDDLPVDATLVHFADVARLRECGCILVDVRYCYVYGGAATEKEVL